MKRTAKMFCSLLLSASLVLGFIPGVSAQENDKTIGESGTVLFSTPDAAPPEIISYSIDKTQAEAGGTITVQAEGKDDASGIDCIYLFFKCEETGKIYEVCCPNGRTYDLEITWYEPSGICYLEEVWVLGFSSSQKYYSKNHLFPPENAKPLPQELSFTISNPDNTPPEIISYSIDKTQVEAGGTINV
ncbi:MAG: hypothetical protein HFG26_13540 [Provencibacterium sp.]|jgi:hypothetical protein|nr:hypothetical protein [Provencibacterium sp.]